MKYDFRVGDYFITNNGEEGYILKTEIFGLNQTGFLLGFTGNKQQFFEYSNNGIYDEDGYRLFEDYFQRIGDYDFTQNDNKLPKVTFVNGHNKEVIIDGIKVWEHRNLYPSDILDILATCGIIEYKYAE